MSRRGGVRPGWTDSARCRVHLAHQQRNAVAASARLSWKGPRPGVDPAIAELGRLLEDYAGYLPEVAKRAGLQRTTIGKWMRCDVDPKLSYVRAALNAIGYDLVVVKRKGPGQ